MFNNNNNNNKLFDLEAFLQVPIHLQLKKWSKNEKRNQYKFIILKLRMKKSNPTCLTEQLWLHL